MQGVRGGESEDFACEARSAGDGEAVRWFGPAREADRRTLAAWCSAVGPVEFIPEPARHQPAPAADSTLAVGTWNVHVGGGDLIGFLQHELGYRCDAQGPGNRNRHFALLVQEAYRASPAVPEASEGAVSRTRIVVVPTATVRPPTR